MQTGFITYIYDLFEYVIIYAQNRQEALEKAEQIYDAYIEIVCDVFDTEKIIYHVNTTIRSLK